MVNIYLLKCPITQEVRYVGKTIKSLNRRLSDHLWAKNKSHKTSWIISLTKQNLKPLIELIEIVEETVWQEREIYWIKFYKDLGANLCNHTIGGEGQHGAKRSNETKKLMSNAHVGRKYKPKTEEQKFNISKGVKTYLISQKLENTMVGGNRDVKGSNNGSAKLNEEKVKEIKQLLKQKVDIYTISKQYNVSPTNISKIKTNKTWKHIKESDQN